MTHAYVNSVTTAVPQHEAHGAFLRFARRQLGAAPARLRLFDRMAKRGGIESRYCCFEPALDAGDYVDVDGLFRRGAFPGTGERMDLYRQYASPLAEKAVAALNLGKARSGITHLIVTSCTGFFSPGLDLEIMRRCGLRDSVERTIIGFMGCHAAVNALKLARHVVRSEPGARVLIVNLELCTLHLNETADVESLLTFLLWGDGCAASIVSADPTGFRLDGFHSAVAEATGDLMTWSIGDRGFDMTLSGQVPGAINKVLTQGRREILAGRTPEEIGMWAIHPGGRSVLDQVAQSLSLCERRMAPAREVLRRYGNMSSTTVMFVLKALLEAREETGLGCGMAFGPGLAAETFTFSRAA